MGNSLSYELPKDGKMRRMVLRSPGSGDMTKAKLEVEEVDIPTPKSGEVLIKVCGAPVNPSDYGEWVRPASDSDEAKPIGKEGSGIVVASGGGFSARGMVGKKVGFCIMPTGKATVPKGAYSEYVTANAMTGAFVLPEEVVIEDACSFFVNPYTVFGILDTAKARAAASNGSPGLIHTAAASQLGQMMVKIAPEMNMTLINVVRREDQAEHLRGLGATHVVVTGEEGWQAKLKALVKELKINVAFDAIAGSMAGELVSVLPKGGSYYNYGGLSMEGLSGINPLDIIYMEKKIEGWLLPRWLNEGGTVKLLMRIRSAGACVNAGLVKKDGWSRSQFVDCDLDTMWPQFLDMFTNINKGGFTNKKLRVVFPHPVAIAVAKKEAAPAAKKEEEKAAEEKTEEAPKEEAPAASE